jgi:hypothetical protein
MVIAPRRGQPFHNPSATSDAIAGRAGIDIGPLRGAGARMHHHFLVAYIDPGSGMLLLQGLVAGTVGALAIFRNALTNFTSKLFGRRRSEEASGPDLDTPTR